MIALGAELVEGMHAIGCSARGTERAVVEWAQRVPGLRLATERVEWGARCAAGLLRLAILR